MSDAQGASAPLLEIAAPAPPSASTGPGITTAWKPTPRKRCKVPTLESAGSCAAFLLHVLPAGFIRIRD